MNNSERLYFLYQKFLNAVATEQEIKELFELANDPENESFFLQLTSASWDELSDTEKLILKHTSRATHPIKKYSKILYPAIAASILFVVGIAVFFYLKQDIKPERKSIVRKIPQTQILPGTEKATLVLANGQQIVLDDSANGAVAKQGNVNIIKLNNGKLIYQSGKENTAELMYNTITTPKGGQYHIVLPDGSEVWLNAASSLRFPAAFVAGERNIALTGEAYFEVAKDQHKPFRVSVNGETVEVLGTHFNIMAYAEESAVKTTLAEGAVKIIKGINTAILKPGEQAQVKGGMIKIVEDPEIVEEALAWKNGNFLFLHPTNIKSIMDQISRWYDVEIEYRGDISGLNFFGTTSRKSNVTALLKIFEATGTVQFEIQNKKIIVKPQ